MRFGASRHTYVPAFDGLRAVAVISVVLVHLGPTSASWLEAARGRGWFGVDAFFVLSGFLITSLLFDELAARGTINLPRFYVRRALRLQPAYISAVLAALAAGYFLAPQYLATTVPAWPYLLTYTVNLAVAFAVVTPPLLLTVMWTLCLEEQFYLLWPWVFRRVGEGRALRFLLCVVGCLAVYRALLYGWLTSENFFEPSPAAVFRIAFATDTRIDTILIGCALAVAIRTDRPRRLWAVLTNSRAFPPLVVALVVPAIWWLYDPRRYWHYGAVGPAISGVMFAAVVAAIALQPQSWPSRVLSWRPLTFVGKVSYGIYLFHFTVLLTLTIVFGKPYGTVLSLREELVAIALGLSLSVFVAWLHYRCIEAPLMAWREQLGISAPSPTPSAGDLVTVPEGAATTNAA
jgi:peptidoglycan/LPS O-acetylase OafA/YrhL